MTDSVTSFDHGQIVLEDLTEDNVHLVKRLNQVLYYQPMSNHISSFYFDIRCVIHGFLIRALFNSGLELSELHTNILKLSH